MSDEYIRKEDAVDACGKEYPPNTDFERGMICQMIGDKVRIERLQPADVVQVCRCRSCKEYEYSLRWCELLQTTVQPNDFCSYGERREE